MPTIQTVKVRNEGSTTYHLIIGNNLKNDRGQNAPKDALDVETTACDNGEKLFEITENHTDNAFSKTLVSGIYRNINWNTIHHQPKLSELEVELLHSIVKNAHEILRARPNGQVYTQDNLEHIGLATKSDMSNESDASIHEILSAAVELAKLELIQDEHSLCQLDNRGTWLTP